MKTLSEAAENYLSQVGAYLDRGHPLAVALLQSARMVDLAGRPSAMAQFLRTFEAVDARVKGLSPDDQDSLVSLIGPPDHAPTG